MEKLWLNSYDAGVPHEIDPNEYSSLVELIEESFQKYNTKDAYTNLGCAITYQQLDELSKNFAAYLQNECKLKKGDRFAIMMPNLLQYPVALFGALRAGLIVVNVNPLYTARELEHLLKDSGAKGMIVLANFAKTVAKVEANTSLEKVIVTEVGDLFGGFKGVLVNFVVKYLKKMVPPFSLKNSITFKQALAKGSEQTLNRVALSHEDIAFLQYTGGTTGTSKGAMLTHKNMIANLLQATAWIQTFFKQDLKGGIITALPLYHIFSLTANCLTFFRGGITNILITNPRDIPGFIKELKRQPFCVMTGVNTLFNALLHNPDFKTVDFSNFRFTLGGGMAVQKAVAEKWKEVTGVALIEAYGLTETSPAATINPVSLTDYNGSIGLPIPSTEVKICDDEGNELPLGEAGELCIKGPQVMKGYWNDVEKTKGVLDTEGWLKTGDVATIDEKGFVKIVDRKKDMIIVSGFNVYPNEVEDVLVSMPGIKEAAVVGVAAGVRGEVVKAFVVLSDESLTKEEIVNYCRENLTNYKVPKEIEFKDELPKTNVGKVLRRALK